MVMAVPSGQIEVTMVPMPVSLADADATDPDFEVFRDDHRFVADGQRAGKCRHR
jgi:hypothetical protein